jgi:hypothetical protein
MAEKSSGHQKNGRGKKPSGSKRKNRQLDLGKSLLLSNPQDNDQEISPYSVGLAVLLIIALLVFAYGLFYRMATRRNADEPDVEVEEIVSMLHVEEKPTITPVPIKEETNHAAQAAAVYPEVTAVVTQKTAPLQPGKTAEETVRAAVTDPDEYVAGLEEKLRSMAFQNKEMQKKIDMLRGSLLGSEERIGELLKERETLRQRVDQLEEELENATAVLEEIANLQ